MTDPIKYVNTNRLGRDLRNQIKGHFRLQYESSCTDASVLQDISISIRAKVTHVHEEFFLPGEVIMEQGDIVDQLYFVCHGVLELFAALAPAVGLSVVLAVGQSSIADEISTRIKKPELDTPITGGSSF
ncbi:hypothetical protein OROGR_008444 [Orobanche gracilis]